MRSSLVLTSLLLGVTAGLSAAPVAPPAPPQPQRTAGAILGEVESRLYEGPKPEGGDGDNTAAPESLLPTTLPPCPLHLQYPAMSYTS